MHPLVRHRLVLGGQVQGVGFRPYLYRLAHVHGLTGLVRNAPEGVVVEIQGPADAVAAFRRALVPQSPPLARIARCAAAPLAAVPDETAFRIMQSEGGPRDDSSGHEVLVSPDVATCDDCLEELDAPSDPRHRYPFINCTNCGPRYTITADIPYDRPSTTMACFPLCERCAREYHDPGDRRFHAQPTACPVCGPRVWLADASGTALAMQDAAMQEAARRLLAGEILAMKGLGGFHLVCDAADEEAVSRLRRRKHRPGKPLAVMVADLAAARAIAQVDEAEAALLGSLARPIVLLAKGEAPLAQPLAQPLAKPLAKPLAPSLAPGVSCLGVMLPSNPMQHVLFRHVRRLAENRNAGFPVALVMTSGNPGGEPICLGNREALARLADFADAFLLHNRDILIRVDDSVVRLPPADPFPAVLDPPLADCAEADGEALSSPAPGAAPRSPQFLRRARGYVPSPIALPSPPGLRPAPCVLGAGPQLKATLCVTRGEEAFVSQHLGDLENLESFQFFEEMAEHLPRLLRVRPQALVHDLHPDFLSTRWARETAAALDIPALPLQHHAAHAFAILAEHRHAAPALVLALDGAGLGDDGTVWGGECLWADGATGAWKRLGRLRPFPLPGGEAAAREPWRMAMSLGRECGALSPAELPMSLPESLLPAARFLPALLAAGINCPATSSLGRLFDAVSALCDLRHASGYEGEAAILLEEAARAAPEEAQAFPMPVMEAGPLLELDPRPLFAAAMADRRAGVPAPRVSARFHHAVVRGFADLAARLARETGVATVGLSGGVMLNQFLHVHLPRALAARGLTPLLHRRMPPGDACISLGQASWGRLRLSA